VKPAKHWIPSRKEVIWMDCNPQAGREMRDMHPFLVLSPQNFNDKTSLVIGLPMTSAVYNAENPFAVAVGKAKANKVSYVLCHQPKSFDWRARRAKYHSLGMLEQSLFRVVCERLNQIMMLNE